MLQIIREFPVRSEDGQEKCLSECLVKNDTTTQNSSNNRTTYEDRYYRECSGGMHAKRVEKIKEGVYRLDNGEIYYDVN
jgi:hypothetical protein